MFSTVLIHAVFIIVSLLIIFFVDFLLPDFIVQSYIIKFAVKYRKKFVFNGRVEYNL